MEGLLIGVVDNISGGEDVWAGCASWILSGGAVGLA